MSSLEYDFSRRISCVLSDLNSVQNELILEDTPRFGTQAHVQELGWNDGAE